MPLIAASGCQFKALIDEKKYNIFIIGNILLYSIGFMRR